MKEYILCAAIWYKDLPLNPAWTYKSHLPDNCDRGIVFCGQRHYQCMHTMSAITGKKSVLPDVGEYTQGFLTNLNRFVGRTEAAQIALDAGQIDSPRPLLYSEDLY